MHRNLSLFCGDLVPTESLNHLRQKTQAIALLNRLIAEELGILCEAFAARDVPVMSVKGATLAVSAYGDLTLRDFDDIDLIVREEAIAEAQAVLLAQGYESIHGSSSCQENDKEEGPYHLFIKKRTLFKVDLQWVMAHHYFMFRMDRPEFWQRRTVVPLRNNIVPALAVEDLLIVLCVHGCKHAWEQLKWVCDVSELVNAHQHMDWQRVVSQASELRCRRMLYMGLALAHRFFDVRLPQQLMQPICSDPDIPVLVERMPRNLLANPSAGIAETEAPALYLSLKDSWSESFHFGLSLCHGQSSVINVPLSWFRLQSSLQRLYTLVHPFHRATVLVMRLLGLRQTMARWLQSASHWK